MGSAVDHDRGSLDQLIEQAATGQRRAVGRLISVVENGSPRLPELMARLAPSTGRARVVGLTGSPGVGKSTTTNALVGVLRARGERVGVLAVDPSSPFTGGALLGDRIRMQEHALDPEVLIRSMATRGHLGGLAAAAAQALRVFDLAGCATVIIETVGVGQSEVEVAGIADITVVLLAPGMGDGIQAAKAGVLEVGDVFVVNKADRDGAHTVVRELRTMIVLGARDEADWKPSIVSTVASRGEGIDLLIEQLDRCAAHHQESGVWDRRRLDRAWREIEGLALARLRSEISLGGEEGLLSQAQAVRDGRTDAYSAAAVVLEALR